MLEKRKAIYDHCGIVAVYTPNPTPIIPLALRAAGGVQHRGQQGAGLAIFKNGSFLTYIRQGLLSEIFKEKLYFRKGEPRFRYDEKTRIVLVHTRYGTSGDWEETNLQPCVGITNSGERVVVIHNGEFIITDQLKRRVGKTPKGASDTFIFTQALAKMKGTSWEEKIVKTLSLFKGAFSLAIAVNDSLYLARDEFGIRPYVLGKLGNGGFIAASETHALDKIGVSVLREIKRGQIIKISKHGLRVLKEGFNGPGAFCSFEWIYFGLPDSLFPTYERNDNGFYPRRWLSGAAFRERCGEIVAKEASVKNASFVVGVPDSGIPFATGLARGLKAPLVYGIKRDHYDPNGLKRLFQGADLEKIGEKVLGKLSVIADPGIWKNKVVVLGDDSIVRGNVSREVTRTILSLGAKEVHWRVSRINRYFCYLGVSTRTNEELIGATYNLDLKKIAKDIGATSIASISNEGLIRALRPSGPMIIPENQSKDIYLANGLCGGCVTGVYPYDRKGNSYQPKSNF